MHPSDPTLPDLEIWLADRVARRIQAWATEQPGTSVTIEIYPVGTASPDPDENLLTVTKDHTLVAIRVTR